MGDPDIISCHGARRLIENVVFERSILQYSVILHIQGSCYLSRQGTTDNMSIPVKTTPPDSTAAYIIDQLEGERITIPGSKGVFRILASSKQTSGGIAVFTSGAVLSDAPGFHWHAEAHDVFLVTKGFSSCGTGTSAGSWVRAISPIFLR